MDGQRAAATGSATHRTGRDIILRLVLLLCLAGTARAALDDVIIEGIVRLDAPVRLKSATVRVLLNGGQQSAFVRNNGHFSIRVQPGTHFLQVSAVGATFPQVRLDVSSRQKGRFKVTTSHEGNVLSTSSDELSIAALGAELYFEMRQPFNIWSLVKSPMGIMVCIMVFGAVVLPYLMEGVDPEEMKQMQEQMRNQPSLTSMLTGGASGGSSGRQ